MIKSRKVSAATIVSLAILAQAATAAPTVYTVEQDYLDAIAAIDPGALSGSEDFNASAVGDLGAGPTAFTGFDITLNAIGSYGHHQPRRVRHLERV